MKLTVMLPVDKATAIEVIKQQDKETAVPLLSLILGNWMLCEKPVFDKLEILDLAQDAGKDIFVEAAVILNVNTDEEDDYDFSTLDLAKLLTSVIYNAGNLIGLYVENKKDAVTKAVETKLTKSINATRSLANTLFFN